MPTDIPTGAMPVDSGPTEPDLAQSLSQWRDLMLSRPAMTPEDVDELEDHLLDEVTDLRARGLRPDEAFLIAVKRLGAQDELSRTYAKTHSERLWRQLVLTPSTPSGARDAEHFSADPATSDPLRRTLPGGDLVWTLLLGLLAGLAVRIPAEFAATQTADFYLRNLSLLVLPFLAIHLALRSRAWVDARSGLVLLTAGFAASALLVNLYPYAMSPGRSGDGEPGQTLLLSGLHLPIALVVLTGIAYLGERWRSLGAWMNWVRFLGESAIYYVLIVLVGGALVALITLVFTAVGVDPDGLGTVFSWIVPICAAGSVLVVAWLVEAKKSVTENMAPVLTAVFTPLLTLALLAFLVVVLLTGNPVEMDREVLITFDALLIVVAAIVLFTVSARQPLARARALDRMQLVMVLAAIAVDLLMLWAMSGRLATYGTSPNKLAALGCNLLLLVHLAGTAWHYWRVIAGGRTSAALERWQCLALPVFAVWAGVVALVFPPLFGFR